jgi:hypothetical protein
LEISGIPANAGYANETLIAPSKAILVGNKIRIFKLDANLAFWSLPEWLCKRPGPLPARINASIKDKTSEFGRRERRLNVPFPSLTLILK